MQYNWAISGDIPGGPGVKTPPCNTGDLGLISGWETKIPQAAEQLTLQATTTESGCHNYWSAHATTRESMCTT